jgi:hypothetical protein
MSVAVAWSVADTALGTLIAKLIATSTGGHRREEPRPVTSSAHQPALGGS